MRKLLLLIFITLIMFSTVSCQRIFEPIEGDMDSAKTALPKSTLTPSMTPKPTLEPTPEPTPEIDLVQQVIDGLTDEELIGQMVMCGFAGESYSSEFTSLITDDKVGNIILFGDNVDTFSQAEELISEISSFNSTDIPLSFSIDVEGGSVRRFHWSPAIDSEQSLGKKNDETYTYEQFRRIGKKLKEIGITIDLAPVLDIAHNPKGKFLESRMFGGDLSITIPQAKADIKGLHDGGIASIGKHFPGHGETSTDSHEELPVFNSSLSEIEEYELKMFQAAVEEGIDGILVGHLSYPKIDAKNLASNSKIFITDILRNEMKFQGVIMSDDMRMQAIAGTVGIAEGTVRFIEAGGDLVLIGKGISRQKTVLEAIHTALDSGRLTRERLEESVYRILVLKKYPEG